MRDISAFEEAVLVGEGTFGRVFKAVDKLSKERVALKQIIMVQDKEGFPVPSLREIRILKQLKHENIISMKEIVTCSCAGDAKFKVDDVFMAFEYCDFDLGAILTSREVKLSNCHIRSYSKQLLEGVCFMHKQNILHRDLKVSNTMLHNLFSTVRLSSPSLSPSIFKPLVSTTAG